MWQLGHIASSCSLQPGHMSSVSVITIYDSQFGQRILNLFPIIDEMNAISRYNEKRSLGVPYLMLYHKTFSKESDVREFVMTNIDMFRKEDKSKLLK